MAEALYRKYRPQTFAQVVGQDAIERTLKNAVARNQVSHAYLFCGPRGTGKTTTARLLAKALLCAGGPTPQPDGTCPDCLDIAAGVHPDVYELDAASRTGVDNVREEIIGRVAYAPTRGKYKLYIIDEVHMLSAAAFNALLKTLEEPPAHVVFVLCTTDPQKVPDTIISRCQRFDFKRISAEEIAGRLAEVCRAEGAQYEDAALQLLADRARGGMRDALSSLETLLAHDAGRATLAGAEEVVGAANALSSGELLVAVAGRDVAACFAWIDRAAAEGADFMAAAAQLAADVRDCLVMNVAGGASAAVGCGLTPARAEALAGVARTFPADRAARALCVLGDLMAELKTSANQRLSFEIACVRLARPGQDLTLEALAERVEALELNGVPVGVAAPGAVAPAPVSARPAVSQGAPQAVRPAASAVAPAATPAAAATPVASPAARAVNPATPVAAPATQPARPPLPPLDDAQIKAAWPSVLANVKKASPASGALYMNASPRVAPNGDLEVWFPSDNSFAFSAAQTEMHSTNFSGALSRTLGRVVPFVIKQGNAGAPGAPVSVGGAAFGAPAAPAAPGAPGAVSGVVKAVTPAAVPSAAPAAPAVPEPPAPDPVPYDDEFAGEEPLAGSVDANMSDFFAVFGGAAPEEYED